MARGDPQAPWIVEEVDPSLDLSPFTKERLGRLLRGKQVELVGGTRVGRVQKRRSVWDVEGEDGRRWTVPSPPILATGFRDGLDAVRHLFEEGEGGYPLLTGEDESTRTPGLFLVGPAVRHPGVIFCFIYKFRQRFAVVTRAAGRRLDLDPELLDEMVKAHQRGGMFLDDLTCCEVECAC